jgi:hypothetical protein
MAEAETNEETKTMKTKIKIALASALVLLMAAFAAPSASASFGLKEGSVDATVRDEAGNFYDQAGGHPATITTKFKLKTETIKNSQEHERDERFAAEAPLRNVVVEAPPGLIGNPTATPRCDLAEFLVLASEGVGPALFGVPCPDSTQLGLVHTEIELFKRVGELPSALYNLKPQVGQPALFGFYVASVPVLAVPSIRESDYGIDFNVINIDQSVHVLGNDFSFWGNPASPSHDGERGNLLSGLCSTGLSSPCPSGATEKAFLTLPTDCEHGPFDVPLEVQSWKGTSDREAIVSHDDEGNPAGVNHCERVPFTPTMKAQPTTKNASSPSGLEFDMQIPDSGLLNPEGIAQANLKKAVVTLPEGYTLNPSAGEGLGYCTEDQYAAEKVGTQPGQGCPDSSKLGNVTIDSPLLETGELAEGSLYIAQPNDPTKAGQENPFDSLVAMYLVARVPQRGVIVKSAGKVDLDPTTGRITTTFDNLPQLPFSDFQLHLREGGRAPLVTPPSCGEKTTTAELYPYSAPGTPAEVTSVSLITNGPDGGACPTGGLPPFKPGLVAGSINNAAGRFSPFNVRLTRSDSEQEITHFSIKLPPGITGKLAGVPFCPDASIALAKSREHTGGGREEQLVPSCPAASEIGHTLVGAGVGSILTYVPGKVYLAGPYHGSALSIVAITSGVVGPFDIGTVVVREALKINPETAEVFVDATGSDALPHIVDGVTTHLRDIRVYVDRPDFTLNPTSCERTSTASTVLGSGLDFASEADDRPITVTTPYQAADCASLGFAPKLALSLKGATKRGGTPAFKAILTARKGDANIGAAQVTLPHSEFLEQAHIKTICTRAVFKASAVPGADCPAASIYGRAEATTPLLDEPLRGPVYLRSSSHNLPDLVVALNSGKINVDLVGRIDSVAGGRIRNTFEAVPDAPVTKFVLEMQGGKKGLLVNSTDLCKGTNRAISHFSGQNGKASDTKPVLKPGGCKAKKQKHASKRRR